MKHKRSWISLLGFCVLTALAAALALALIFAGASVALGGHEAEAAQTSQSSAELSQHASSRRFTGMITCSRCRARHMRNSRLTSSDCVRTCISAGASYILVDGDLTYVLIGGDETLSRLAGQRANVTGTRQGDAILVDSASSLF